MTRNRNRFFGLTKGCQTATCCKFNITMFSIKKNLICTNDKMLFVQWSVYCLPYNHLDWVDSLAQPTGLWNGVSQTAVAIGHFGRKVNPLAGRGLSHNVNVHLD